MSRASLLNQQIAQADDGGGNVAGTGFNRVGPRIPWRVAGPQPGQQRLDRLARLVPTLELHGTERTGGKDLGAKQVMLGAQDSYEPICRHCFNRLVNGGKE